MDHSVLQIIWFVLIVVLFIGFFFLEGFDYGAGILLPFVAKDDEERRITMNSVGPFWDGNEVWMITAGGAMFAAFPQWYATLFSGFYLALFLILVALIMRGISFEFRSKIEDPRWRNFWDWAHFAGNLLPALLWGVAFANIVAGLPIDGKMNYHGGLWPLLNPYALVGGLASLTIFIVHGAQFLVLKTDGEIQERARKQAALWQKIALVIFIAFIAYSGAATEMFAGGMLGGIIAILGAIALASLFVLHKSQKDGWAFIMTSLTVVLGTLAIFVTLFPNVMVATNPENSLTIYNASSSQYTLQVMFIVALIFTPIVLIYQGFTFWIFREKVRKGTELEY